MRLGWGCATPLNPRNLVSSWDYLQECQELTLNKVQFPWDYNVTYRQTGEFKKIGFQGRGGSRGLTLICPHPVSNLFYESIMFYHVLECSRVF